MHPAACFLQTCDQTELKCGLNRFEEMFSKLSSKLGHAPLQLLQHMKVTYTRPDGKEVVV